MSELLICRELTKNFGNKPALDHLNLTLERGRIVGLLGPNGSGKTTLLKLINGLLVPTEGEVLIDGFKPGVETKTIVSYLPDRMYLGNWMKVCDLLEYYADFYADFDRSRADGMLESLHIRPSDRLRTMSKGTARDYILSTILNNYDENATILISTHLISDIENILDEVLFLKDGQLKLQSSVDEIRLTEGTSVDALFREVFKC